MPTQSELRSQITNQIVQALEGDLIPWRQPWKNRGPRRHSNLVSGKAYSGINPLLLELRSLHLGLASRHWATWDQWKKLGCHIKQRPSHVEPGRWAAQVVFFKPVSKITVDERTGEEKKSSFPLLRTYNVFNVEQVEGEFIDAVRKSEENSEPAGPDYEAAEHLIEASGAEIVFGGDRACYHRPLPHGSWPSHSTGDYIEMPNRSQFNRIGSYYETALHELAHWSDCRLAFDHEKAGYPFCELVAEISSCYLTTELGIPNGENIENHHAYLKHWLDAMKADSSFIIRASSHASKITDFLLSFIKEPAIVV